MDLLAHWDYAAQFSGYQAAALMVGIDPGSPDAPPSDQSPIKAVFERMALHYDHALQRYHHDVLGNFEIDIEVIAHNAPFSLVSLSMYRLFNQWRSDQVPHDTAFADWLMDDRQSAFDAQNFSREEIVDWLQANDLKSVYRFDLGEPSAGEKVAGRWPWGDHHTEMLGHLEAAANKWWVNYDHTDPTTAPTNADVSTWLKNERKLSQNKADAIASILRADGLQAGPRT